MENPARKPIVIGILGGIAAGKSLVSEELRRLELAEKEQAKKNDSNNPSKKAKTSQ